MAANEAEERTRVKRCVAGPDGTAPLLSAIPVAGVYQSRTGDSIYWIAAPSLSGERGPIFPS